MKSLNERFESSGKTNDRSKKQDTPRVSCFFSRKVYAWGKGGEVEIHGTPSLSSCFIVRNLKKKTITLKG